jgi:hypothetical protein
MPDRVPTGSSVGDEGREIIALIANPCLPISRSAARHRAFFGIFGSANFPTVVGLISACPQGARRADKKAVGANAK